MRPAAARVLVDGGRGGRGPQEIRTVPVGAWSNLPAWPVAAPLLGVAMGLVLAGRCWRRILPLLATVLMATAALMVVIDQVRFRYPRDFIWPTFFDQYHVIGVLAVLCTLAEAIRTLLARRAVRPTPRASVTADGTGHQPRQQDRCRRKHRDHG